MPPQRRVSIHAPHEGERRRWALIRCGVVGFQSTLPTRGSDGTVATVAEAAKKCFNPRSPRGGATLCMLVRDRIQRVSIHAPHEGERPQKKHLFYRARMFQSTLPTRGSDAPLLILRSVLSGFNPRSPRGGATQKAHFFTNILSFQSTLPTRGSD